jgi:branched-chain amino acid transport system substrate-binding protein
VRIKKTLFTLILIIGAVFLVFWLIWQRPKSNDGPTISAILPLTGNLSFMGQPEKNGLELAVADYRANPSSKYKNLRLVIEDSQSTPLGAINAGQKLLQVDKPIAMLVANTGPNLALAPITEKNEVVQIAFCMEPDIQKKHSLIFRLYESATQEGEAILAYLKANKKNYRTIGFLYIDQPNFVKTVEDVIAPGLGGSDNPAILQERYRLDQGSFRSVLSKFQEKKIDCMVLLGYGSEYRLIFDQMKELGMIGQMEIIGGWGFLYPQVSTDLLEGVRVAAPVAAFSENAISVHFRQKYVEQYMEQPNFDAAYAYSAFHIILSAINNAEPLSTLTISQAIEGGTFETPVGTVHVRERELVVPVGMAVYRRGALTSLK